MSATPDLHFRSISKRSPSPASPQTRRSYGADAYSVDHIKSQSQSLHKEPKDQDTITTEVLSQCDARCTIVVGSLIWVGEKNGDISIRRKTSGEVVHIIERRKGAYVWALAEVGDYVWAGCSDGFIRVLSKTTYTLSRQVSRHAGGGGGVHCLAYHVPSQTVFSGSNDFEIIAWDATRLEFLKQFSGHGGAVRCLLATSHLLYSGSDDGTVIVWDIALGKSVQQWGSSHKGKSIHSICQTESHIWSGCEDATIRIWNPASGECVAVAEMHTGAVEALTTVGNKVWSAAGDIVCIWDAVSLSLLGTYVVHDGYINSILITDKVTQYKVCTFATDGKVQGWSTKCSPDETAVIGKRVARLDAVEYEVAHLKQQLLQRDEEIRVLKQSLAHADEEIIKLRPFVTEVERLGAAVHLAEERASEQESLRLRFEAAARIEGGSRLHAEDRARAAEDEARIAAARAADAERYAHIATERAYLADSLHLTHAQALSDSLHLTRPLSPSRLPPPLPLPLPTSPITTPAPQQWVSPTHTMPNISRTSMSPTHVRPEY